MVRRLAGILAANPEAQLPSPGLLLALLRPATGDPLLLAGAVAATVALIAAGYVFVLLGGGTKFSGTYSLLLPVLLAATVFHMPGGVAAGALAGLALGPGMPLDVAAGMPQPVENWLARLFWFVGLGMSVAALTAVPRWRKGLRDQALLVDEMSGLLTPDALRVAAAGSRPAYAVAVDFGMYERLLDAHGRGTADAYLRAVAGHLRNAVGHGGTMSPRPLTRIRLDVFGLLVPADPGVLDHTIEAIQERMPRWVSLAAPEAAAPAGQARIEAEPLVVPVTTHVGFAEIGALELDDFDTFRNAVRAARAAREARRPVTRYDSASVPVARENVQMAAELLQALERGELSLAFQPKVRMSDGAVTAAEALLRWNSPRRGPVSPAQFIPVAEQSSLISALTGWVLDRTAETLSGWQGDGRALRLSVNLSGRDLLDDRVLDRLRRLPARTGMVASALSLEITETAFIGDLGEIALQLQRLRDDGYDILVDDFGTGCSSFAYLHRLPVDGVKIDRAFVSALRTDATAEKLVGSMVDWCRKVGKRTIAEGVEDAATAEVLKAMGCDEIQGYWISRPLPPADLLRWVDGRADYREAAQ